MNKVGITIPTYNQQAYIGKSIESALSQSYQNIEIFILDDCSTDKTEAVVNFYSKHKNLIYIRNNNNIGRVKNYRQGLDLASDCEYIVNLDGDDWLTDKDFISNAVSILDRNPQVGFYLANAAIYYEDRELYAFPDDQSSNVELIPGADFVNSFFSGKQFFYHLSSVYRRKDALECNFYTENSTWTDGISFLRLGLIRDVAVTKTVVGVWRLQQHNESAKFYSNYSFSDIFEVVDLIESESGLILSGSANKSRFNSAYHYIAWLSKNDKKMIIPYLKYLNSNYPMVLHNYGFYLALKLVANGTKFIARNFISIIIEKFKFFDK